MTIKVQICSKTTINEVVGVKVNAVLTLLNRLSQDAQSPDRFITLPTHDQTALQTLLADGLIIIDDSRRALLLGKAFEEQVKNHLESE
jgi:hypothetical protein